MQPASLAVFMTVLSVASLRQAVAFTRRSFGFHARVEVFWQLNRAEPFSHRVFEGAVSLGVGRVAHCDCGVSSCLQHPSSHVAEGPMSWSIR